MTQKIGRFRVEKVVRSKISENRRTSLMDVPKPSKVTFREVTKRISITGLSFPDWKIPIWR